MRHHTKDNEKHEYSELTQKVMQGVNMAFKNLVEERSLKNDSLSFGSSDGHVFRVKAREMKEKLKRIFHHHHHHRRKSPDSPDKSTPKV